MLKIIVFAIVIAIVIVYLKSINSEIANLVILAGGLLLLGLSIDYLTGIIEFFQTVSEMCGLDNDIYVIIYKIVSVGIIVEFGAQTIEDMGLKSIADKVVFVGKLIILSVSLPIFYGIINLIKGFV